MTLNHQDRDILWRIEKKQDDMQVLISKLPCDMNCFKIALLQKVVYGAIAIILVAFMATLIAGPNTSRSYRKSAVIEKPIEPHPRTEVHFIII